MKCLGCYTETREGYCLKCRKKLFGGLRIPAVLDFDAPRADNLEIFQELSKRLSISGVQLKYSLRLENKKLVLTEKGGEYILKPIPPSKQLVHLDEVPENEHASMQIAEQVFGIPTAANALIRFKDGEQAYLTRRFDVTEDGSKLQQEDFAQLTQRTAQTHGETFKYQGSYEEIGKLIQKFVAAAQPAIEKYFQLVLFNYLISNGDAHLKNFSLISHHNAEYILTPAYDLMCTVLHTPQEPDTALDLYQGDIYSPYYSSYGHYGRENFMELAHRLGIISKRAERIINGFLVKQAQVRAMVEGSFLAAEIKDIYLAKFFDKLSRIG